MLQSDKDVIQAVRPVVHSVQHQQEPISRTTERISTKKTTKTIPQTRFYIQWFQLTWLMNRFKFLKSSELSNKPCTIITGLYPTTEAQRHAPSSGYSKAETQLLLVLVVVVHRQEPFIVSTNN